ncbi:hypothetical protein BGX33_009160 [Mortierella sp. NVP41]|nr:hypothetical protein BGX33_009160 [Mortierella sp. NVP41]
MATSGNWTEPSTVGSGPAAYGESCMVSVQGGRKMIVFGGRMETQDPVTDLHILDLTTTPYTWMSGTSASSGRAGMACASAGNYFVAWGGTNGTAFPSEILYYNLATNQWISEDSLNGIPRRTPSNNGLSKSAIAALGGGIAAAVALGVPAVFLILRRRRRRNDKLVTAGSEDAREGQKDGYTTDEKDYSDLKADFASKRAPQWAKDSQDMSLMAMNVYEGLGAPHKYLLNQYNSPQHISPFAAANNNNLSDPYQQQQQDDATWPRSPQDASVSATSPDDDAVKHLALIEAKHQRMMERIQREQEAELSVLQQMLEQKNAEQTSP